MGTPAIFLDRDGVLNENRPDHVKEWGEFVPIPGAIEAVAALTALRLPIIIVTNQAIVNRRIVGREQVDTIHGRLLAHVRGAGGDLRDVLYCPHTPGEGCACRKPAPGLLLAAARHHDLDLARSVLVGDACSDIAAGRHAGCRTLLVLTGRGREALAAVRAGKGERPTAVVADLAAAVPHIAALVGDPLATPLTPPQDRAGELALSAFAPGS